MNTKNSTMETNFELFDNCVKTIVVNSAADNKAARNGIISNQEACISIIHNYLKSNVLDKKRLDNLECVLYDYAINKLSTNGCFGDYKLDYKCPEMCIEDYVDNIFMKSDYFSVKEADVGNGGYNIWIATLGLVREMLNLLHK